MKNHEENCFDESSANDSSRWIDAMAKYQMLTTLTSHIPISPVYESRLLIGPDQ